MYLTITARNMNTEFITCSTYMQKIVRFTDLLRYLPVPISLFRDMKIRGIFLWRLTYTIFKMSPVWEIHFHTPKFSTSSRFYTEWTFLNEMHRHHHVYYRKFSFHQFLQIRHIRCLFFYRQMEPLYLTEKSFYLQFFNISWIADFTMLNARPTSREFLISLKEALPLAALLHNMSMQFSSQVVILVIN